MNSRSITRLAALAAVALLPAGAALALPVRSEGSRQEAVRPVRALETRLESLDWYSEADALNLRFSITNNNATSVWVQRYQLPNGEIDHDLLTVTRDGEPVPYIGPLVKRAAPTADDYIEIKPGETYTVVFDPSSVYDMRMQGNYKVGYKVQTLGARTTVPQRRPEIPTRLLRDPEMAPIAVDAMPNRQLQVAQAADVAFYFQGLPYDLREDITEVQRGIGGYTSCTTSQQTALKTAHANAITISGKAINHLAANPSGSSLYTYWFGTYTSSRFSTVKSHYNAVNSAFSTKSVTYNCKCSQSAYAYVYPTKPYTIYLCKAFWSAPALGRDSKAGTLVHEMTHFNVTASTDDYVYGASGAHNLALSNPTKAIDNADNHEYFAEDQP